MLLKDSRRYNEIKQKLEDYKNEIDTAKQDRLKKIRQDITELIKTTPEVKTMFAVDLDTVLLKFIEREKNGDTTRKEENSVDKNEKAEKEKTEQTKKEQSEKVKTENVENVEDVEKENTAKDEKLVDLLKQRAEIQFQLMVLRGCLLEKNAKKFAKGKVDGLGKYLKEQAKKYGVNETEYASVIKEYQDALNDAKIQYMEQQQEYLSLIGSYEEMENKSILELKKAKDEKKKYTRSSEYRKLKKKMDKEHKKYESMSEDYLKLLYNKKVEEGKTAFEDGDYNKVNEINEELKQIQAIKKLKGFDNKINEHKGKIESVRKTKKHLQNSLEENKDDYEKKLDDIDQTKEKSLAKIDKQSIIGKTIGRISSLFKKINGNEKFQNEIVTPVKETTTHIVTEVIPSIAKGIKTGIESIPGGIKSVAENLKQKKNKAIDRFKASIKDKNAKDQEKLDNIKTEVSKDDNDEREGI